MILTAVGVISHSDDAHWLLRDVGAQDFHVSSCVLVGSEDCPPHPVGPEDVVSIHGQAEGMDGLVLQQDLQQEHEGRIPLKSAPRRRRYGRFSTQLGTLRGTVCVSTTGSRD